MHASVPNSPSQRQNSVEANADQNTENENVHEENVVRRLNENPNQFFKVKILTVPPPKETFSMLSMVKKALIVNIVSFCQFAVLFPIYLIDIYLLFHFNSCDENNLASVLLILGFCSVLGLICFPICLEKKLDRF